MKCKFKKIDVVVRGVSRSVYLEKQVEPNIWQARTYVKSKTVSGFVRKNTLGALRFTPTGINAGLLG